MDKTKEQLTQELAAAHKRIAALETLAAENQHWQAEFQAAEKRAHNLLQEYHSLFNNSPVAHSFSDLSGIKRAFDVLHAQGITDLGAYIDSHPELLAYYDSLIKTIRVNQAVVDLAKATSKDELLQRESEIRLATNTNVEDFRQMCIAFYKGSLQFDVETTYR